MNFEDKLTVTLLGAVLGFIFTYLLWLLREISTEQKRKLNILRVIKADIKATLQTFSVIESYDLYFNKLTEQDPTPLLLFNPSRMSNFFLDFKEDIYLIPTSFTEELLNYYDDINACNLMCNIFKEEEFKALPFARRKSGYLKWLSRLRETDQKGKKLIKLLELRLK